MYLFILVTSAFNNWIKVGIPTASTEAYARRVYI